MVTHLSSKKEQQALRNTFNQFDKNGDGKIERQEFIDAYKKIYPHIDPVQVEKEANDFFTQADQDGNGEIDFGEWCAATINKRQLLNETNLKAAFQLFDRDNGGSISAQEVAEILGHNMAKDKAVWDDIIKEVDLNGDGQIDFTEFKQMMEKFIDAEGLPN